MKVGFVRVDENGAGVAAPKVCFSFSPRPKPVLAAYSQQALKGRVNCRVDRANPSEVESPFQGLRDTGPFSQGVALG